MKHLFILISLVILSLVVSISCKTETAPKPIASFTMSKDSAEIEEIITFINESQYATIYEWNFGDGNSSTNENPSHSYTSSGNYSISLKAIGEADMDSTSKTIIIVDSSEIIVDSSEIFSNSCEGCHTDYERLIAVHSPDTAFPESVLGQKPPHYEPYDRVYMGGTGFSEFEASSHYSIGCTGCHNGVGNSGDKSEAHSGDWIKSPSLIHEEKCAVCHESISHGYMTSLHLGTGQKRAVAMRSGLSGAIDFDNLPAHQIAAYNAKCSSCHGTCGNCHVVRPASGGGGLISGHSFNKTPQWFNVCISCHFASTGSDYLGSGSGTEPDAHQAKLGFTCLDCHDGSELHGNGQAVEHRYAYTELPNCQDCHAGLATANTYHAMHFDDLQCQVCHSQSYNVCGSCHIKDDQLEIDASPDFKIAKNTIPGIRGNQLALVSRTPAHPDNWVGYGEELEYSSFETLPTFNYTTPHNILKWTSRTNVEEGASCASNCHIRNEGGTLINSELFLWKNDLKTWEVEATQDYTVDETLPENWFIE